MEEELRKLQDLFDMGFIGDEEYRRRKSEITGQPIDSHSDNTGNNNSDPYSHSNTYSDPYSLPQSDPYSLPQSDPYSLPQSDPYSLPQSDPYSLPQSDPYSLPQSDPYSLPQSDPYSLPHSDTGSHSDPYSLPQYDPYSYTTSNDPDPYSLPTNDPYSLPDPTPKPISIPPPPPQPTPAPIPVPLPPPVPLPSPIMPTPTPNPVATTPPPQRRQNRSEQSSQGSKDDDVTFPMTQKAPVLGRTFKQYGKTIKGVVIYITTRSGTQQSDLFTESVTLREIVLKFFPNADNFSSYYLQDLFDKTKLINKTKDQVKDKVPHGQYYLKLKVETCIIGTGKLVNTSGPRETKIKEYYDSSIATEKYRVSSKNYVVTSAESTLHTFIDSSNGQDACYNLCFGFDHNITLAHKNFILDPSLPSEYKETMDKHLPILVIAHDVVYCLPAKTKLSRIRQIIGISAAKLVNIHKHLRSFNNDEDTVADGLYKVEQELHNSYRAPNTLRVNKARNEIYSLDHPLYNAKHGAEMHFSLPVVPKNDYPMEEHHHEVDREKIAASMEQYATRKTLDGVAKLHFFSRVRFLQEKNHSIGSISSRLSNNQCIISGTPLEYSDTDHMCSKHLDEITKGLIDQLKENNEWKKITENPDPTNDNDQQPQHEEKKPEIRYGDEEEPKEKFSYGVTADSVQYLKEGWMKRRFLKPIGSDIQ
eukprot:TRINITY_DN1490_c0_g1_i1.p1 TRINITY_DN1490_c0_g1~~TRINITY_DN1490_c0_g1_i1.p1  ORF type:complete len:700 (-),score=138.98 TRINITY_DN1490_c0_g1_i1:174-2273(-)